MTKSHLRHMPFGMAPPPPINSLADLLKRYPPPEVQNALWASRPKTEYVSGYYRTVSCGLLGSYYEWVPGYWRKEGV